MGKLPERMCKCGEQAILSSPVELFCGRCGGRLASKDIAQEVDAQNYKDTNSDASKNKEGLLDQYAEVYVSNKTHSPRKKRDIDRAKRALLKSLGGIFIAASGGVIAAFINDRWLGSESVDQKVIEQSFNEITTHDISFIENYLKAGKRISNLAQKFHTKRHHGVGLLSDALAAHTEGQSPSKAIDILEELLKHDRPSDVREYLLLCHAKALGAAGRPAEGIYDLDKILALPAVVHDPKKKLKYLRQALNHSYILLSPSDLSGPGTWSRFGRYLSDAVETLGLPEVNYNDFDKRTRMSANYDSLYGPGILIFEAIYLAEQRRDDRSECERILKWHLDLIKIFESEDAVNGWNRYTPLAAQAIRLGHLDIAEQVLNTAASRPRAQMLESQEGLEWLLHRTLWAVQMLQKGNKRRARVILDGLFDSRFENRLWPYYRQLSAYAIKAGLYNDSYQNIIDHRVGAMNVPSFTHSAYFPAWNKDFWGT